MNREEFQKMVESDEKLLKRFQENPIQVCSEYGIELTEEELEQVSGGWSKGIKGKNCTCTFDSE